MKKSKGFIALLLVLLLVLGACASPAPVDNAAQNTQAPAQTPAQAMYIAGSYEAEASGFGGTLKLTLTAGANAIENVEVTEHSETEGVGTLAIAELPDKIVQAQSTDIDTVSGCTMTSRAILDAAGTAIKMAKGESTVAAAGLTAGTYSANAEGHNAPITVTVVLSETKIESFTVESKESNGIGTAAIALIHEAVIQNGTLNVDAITGATVTSNAVLSCLREIVRNAGGDPSGMNAAVAASEASATPVMMSADVVIIGAGGAGYAAATTAAEAGSSVIIVDKAPYIGGNTIRAGGTLNAVDPERQGKIGVEDSVENFYDNIMTAGDNKSDPALARTLAQNAMSARQWLEDHGTVWSETVYLTIGGLFTRSMDVKDKDSFKGFIEPLDAAVREHGGEVVLNCKAEELLLDGAGRVVGVRCVDTRNGQTYEISANNGVVIATGGYSASPEMVQKYHGLTGLPTSNAPTSTGDGINLGLQAGAALEGMEYIQLHPHGNPATGMLESHFAGDVTNAIYVNREGARFVSEQGRRDEISNATIAQTDQIMFSIYDAECDVYPGQPEYDGMDDLLAKKYVYKADTLEELAAQAGIDADGLKKAVERYNALIRSGADADFHKKEIEKEIGVAPFYCVPMSPTLHHTMGGLKIDTDARVLKDDGTPVACLYAAGEVTAAFTAATASAATPSRTASCLEGLRATAPRAQNKDRA
ncbi:flavocytochrome c [Christensenellaceae bacterium OttesenSCG-928-M15]|nr:flavocytochrome c [Christensenellaceae bacterium OttesenSCG-928-M15]